MSTPRFVPAKAAGSRPCGHKDDVQLQQMRKSMLGWLWMCAITLTVATGSVLSIWFFDVSKFYS